MKVNSTGGERQTPFSMAARYASMLTLRGEMKKGVIWSSLLIAAKGNLD
jgi:hypothetical protein